MTARLTGKNLIVIGASSGIGRATVRRLCAEGAHVCAAGLDPARLAATAAEAAEAGAQTGGQAFAQEIDIAEEASVQSGIAAAAARMGALDGAHINAADMGAIMQDSNILDIDMGIFDRTLAVGLRGHALATRAVLPHLLARGGGAIVYTSSGACNAGEPVRPAYAIAKSGINALMRHVASAYGRQGVRANAIAPGYIPTPELIAAGHVPQDLVAQVSARMPSHRIGVVEDIAAMVAMLMSQDGEWIQAQVLHVNGGALM